MDTPLCFTNRLWYTTSRVLFFMKFMFLKKMIGASCFGPMPCMGIVLTSFGHFSRGMVFPVCPVMRSLCRSDISAWAQITISWK